MKNSTVILFSFIVLIAFSSFSQNNEEKLIIENSGFFYSYEVFQKNENSNELDGGTIYESTFTGFEAKRAGLRFMISSSIVDSYKHKEIEFKGIKDTVVNRIDFTGKWNKTAKQQFLADVLDYYNVKISKKETKENFLEVYVVDEEKLNKFVSTTSTKASSSRSTDDGKMLNKNTSLKQAINMLSGNAVYNGDSSKRYNLEFSNDSIEANQEYLEKYGLTYRKIKEPVMHYMVEKDK